MFQFVASLASIGIGIFLFIITMVKDMKRTVKDLSKLSKTEPLLKKQLYDFIEFHSIAKQLSSLSMNKNPNKDCFELNFIYRLVRDASKLEQPMNMVVFTWSCAALGIAMLTIKMELVRRFSPFLNC